MEAPVALIFDPAPLPRGPHGLTREQVAAIQRERLLAAIARLAAEDGYAAATITATARRAGISPNVFYEHFAGKDECFLAAYEVFAARLLERVLERVEPTARWGDFVESACGAYLDALEADRGAARAFLLEMDGAGPQAREARHRTFAAFAAIIERRHTEMRQLDPSLGPIADRVFYGLAIGVRALICDYLEHAPGRPLPELHDDVVFWVTATVHGAAAATRTAR